MDQPGALRESGDSAGPHLGGCLGAICHPSPAPEFSANARYPAHDAGRERDACADCRGVAGKGPSPPEKTARPATAAARECPPPIWPRSCKRPTVPRPPQSSARNGRILPKNSAARAGAERAAAASAGAARPNPSREENRRRARRIYAPRINLVASRTRLPLMSGRLRRNSHPLSSKQRFQPNDRRNPDYEQRKETNGMGHARGSDPRGLGLGGGFGKFSPFPGTGRGARRRRLHDSLHLRAAPARLADRLGGVGDGAPRRRKRIS